MSLNLSKYEGHTPGPWATTVANVFRVVAPHQKHNNKPEGMCPAYPYLIICETVPESLNVPEVAAINARLIADAPQLLAELKEARKENERAINLLRSLVAWDENRGNAELLAEIIQDSKGLI